MNREDKGLDLLIPFRSGKLLLRLKPVMKQTIIITATDLFLWRKGIAILHQINY